jgi:hypothetical protein
MSNKIIFEKTWLNPNQIPVTQSFNKNLKGFNKLYLKDCVEYIDNAIPKEFNLYEGYNLISNIRVNNQILNTRLSTVGYKILKIFVNITYEGAIATSTGRVNLRFNDDSRNIYRYNANSALQTYGTTYTNYDLQGNATSNAFIISDATGTAVTAGSSILTEFVFSILPNTQRIGYQHHSGNRTTTTGYASVQWMNYNDIVTPIDVINIFSIRALTGSILVYGI